MKLPKWAPSELVEIYQSLKPKADAEQSRGAGPADAERPSTDWKTSVQSGEPLHLGAVFVGDAEKLRILESLIAKPVMEPVWKNLGRRSSTYQHVHLGIYGGQTQTINLLGSCIRAEHRWQNLPKRTRTESKKLHEEIATRAIQLCELLVEVDQPGDLLDVRKYIEEEKLSEFMEAIEQALVEEGETDWLGFDAHLEHLLSEMLPALPRILLDLHKRSLERAKNPRAVSQPNSPNAKLNFFIHELSKYFHQAYGQPLNAYVAGVVSALFNEDVDEDRVRALLRARREASKKRFRKKVQEQQRKISG